MLIGVPKEIKDHEYRVGLTPAGVHALWSNTATRCWSRRGPVRGSASPMPSIRRRARASFAVRQRKSGPPTWWSRSRSCRRPSIALPRRGQILFAYLHLAPEPELLGRIAGLRHQRTSRTRP